MRPAAGQPHTLADWLSWSPTAAVNALKTALGLIIAWALVLWLQWPSPFLAPMAVLFLQTPYLGASLRKGLMRVFGTLAGALAVLVLLAWLIQDRWALLAALSLLIGFAVYQTRVSQYGYAWLMVAITATVIATDAVPRPELAFQLAVYRTSEAVLGIVIVLMINGLLWPRTAGRVYQREVDAALERLAEYLRALATTLRAAPRAEIPEPPRALFGAAVRLRDILTAAVLDSGGYRRLRDTYEAQIRALTAVTGSVLALAETLRLALDPHLPPMDAAQRSALAGALDGLAGVLASRGPSETSAPPAWPSGSSAPSPSVPQPPLSESPLSDSSSPEPLTRIAARLAALSHDITATDGHGQALRLAASHQCAALAADIRQLEQATAALAAGRQLAVAEPSACAPTSLPAFDKAPLRRQLSRGLPHALVAVIAFWAVLVIWFQWQWPPSGFLAALMAVVIIGIDSLNDLPAEQPGHRVFLGALAGTVLTAPLYLLVMPKLDGFLELALVLFPFYYLGLYFFHAHVKPRNLYFLGALLMAILMPALAPEQTISLLGYLNAAASVLNGFLVGLVVLGVVLGQRPQQQLKRGLRGLLLGILSSQRALAKRGRPDFARLVLASEQHQREQLQHLAQVAPLASDPAVPQNDQAKIDALIAAAQSLSIRARALQRARLRLDARSANRRAPTHQPAGWRPFPLGRRYRRVFAALLRQLAARLDRPQARIRVDALDRLRAWALPELSRMQSQGAATAETPEERARQHYLLAIAGHYIGVARALRELAAAVEAIDWAASQRPRF